MARLDLDQARARLAATRLMLLFTPELVRARNPWTLLESVLPWVGIVQVRIKLPARTSGPSPAGELFDCCCQVLDCVAGRALVLVNDRVDVALALLELGLAGVHLGQGDLPPEETRALLGPQALVGLSTHSLEQAEAAHELPVDYLGFGPVFRSRTKGYERGLGPEQTWLASRVSHLPLFAIGGIDLENIGDLEGTGRVAVSSALLQAADPPSAARALSAALEGQAF